MSSEVFDKFISLLQDELSRKLPGQPAHLEMFPVTRSIALSKTNGDKSPKPSAVLVLFFPKNDRVKFALVKRANYPGVHSGQIALPGGQYELTDQDVASTALRETKEEIGIDPKKVQLLGGLTPLYIPPSNFDVFPFVGSYPENQPFKIDAVEIDQILEIDLDDLMKAVNKTNKIIQHRTGIQISVPCFYLNGEIVWGATAMILNELRKLIEKGWSALNV